MMSSDRYFIDDAENNMGRCLVLKSQWSDDFIEIIRKESISVLRLSDSMGWRAENISFLEKLQDLGLRGVEVYALDVKDLTPLRFIHRLEYLGLQCEFTRAPDFSDFSQLKILKLLWRPIANTIFKCGALQHLNIVNYPDVDLLKLQAMTELKRLQLKSRNIQSLAGVECLKNLEFLDLAYCTKLETLAGVEKCLELQMVELDNCKKIKDVAVLGELPGLKHFVLANCKNIRSLQPLSKCSFLESLIFVGDTNVEDGELGPLLEMPRLKNMRFMDRRHYTHKMQDVLSMLS